jgi:hypothetical protein
LSSRSEHCGASGDSTGKKAFEETPERRKLRLKESKAVGDGVLVLIYERSA